MSKINLRHDFEIDLATASSRMSKKWRNRRWTWSELVERCRVTQRTGETAKEYEKMSREQQSQVKDVGGFVGGYLQDGVRKNTHVKYRTVATLDIDYGTMNVWDDFTMAYGFAAMIYSTHKHSDDHPRFRLVFPLSRQVTPDEYEPLCRRIAATVGIDLFDDTTYELPRLFYWPSTSKDAEYVFDYQDGPACDVDSVLATYTDYRDASAWPLSSREDDRVAHAIKKAGDPTKKPGLIGAWCRCYSIEEVIEKFLAEKYEPTAMEGRYTYKEGSVAGGLVTYEGKFAYSHHDTDPVSKQLCNAFDLCRIHLYGEQDENSHATEPTRLPSYMAMQDFIAKDKKVRKLLLKERRESAKSDFGGIELPPTDNPVDDNNDWEAALEMDRKGKVMSTTSNMMIILDNDPRLKDHLWHDLFSGFDLVKGGLPWDPNAKAWGDRDDANLRVYMEQNYGITGKDKIKDAKDAVLTSHRFHPIRDYLNGLQWDGVERLDRLIVDYLGAEDNELNRVMTRKHFTAAVARVMEPGVKYDHCLIMAGPEGVGKSTLLSIMGGEWFNDSITTTEGKEGMEQLRRAWFIELAELSSIKRSDVEQVKNYITRTDDIYRAAYGTTVTKHPRQCVFCGTTNEQYFLKGDTGNRRFWVININPELRKYSHWREMIIIDRDQLWAEAVYYWKEGEPLFLDDRLEAEARSRQTEYNDDKDDPVKDLLVAFLDRKVPEDWSTWDLMRRRAYWNNPDPLDEVGTVQRTRFCVPEFLCERMGRNMGDKEYKYMSRKIAKMMDDIEGWERKSTSKHVEKLYGIQRAWVKTEDEETEETL